MSEYGVDPRGPVFLCYRRADGYALAEELAWTLRVVGVPVWHDQTDLPPGDTTRRLEEALAAGLSGAVLVITPEISASKVVRENELPRLLSLERDPRFTFQIASAILDDHNKVDIEAPERLLGQPPGTLRRFFQHRIDTPDGRTAIAHWQARRRVEHLREDVAARCGHRLDLEIETRGHPQVAPSDADLVIRLPPPPPGWRTPPREGLIALKGFLTRLPELISAAGARSVRICGGAHLTVACALGAALPTTLLGPVEVRDRAGATWPDPGGFPAMGASLLVGTPRELAGGHRPVLVYLDLTPGCHDTPYDALVTATRRDLAATCHLRPRTEGPLAPADAHRLVTEADTAIRDLAGAYDTTEVHLLLRTPFPMAVLIGRRINTLRVHLYEFEDAPTADGAPAAPRYIKTLILRVGAGDGPIDQVMVGEKASP